MTNPLNATLHAMRNDLRNRRNINRSLLVLALLASGVSQAADPPKKESSFGSAKTGSPLLTRDQLRACLAQKIKLAQQDTDMLKEQGELAAIKADIAAKGEALKTQLESTDRTDAQAVAAYNEAGSARDKQIDAYEARVAPFNDRVDALKAERESFGKSCSNRRYLEDDEIAIRKGK